MNQKLIDRLGEISESCGASWIADTCKEAATALETAEREKREALEELRVGAERAVQYHVNRYEAAEAKLEKVTRIGRALLAADERGQGVPWSEAMDAMHHMIGTPQSAEPIHEGGGAPRVVGDLMIWEGAPPDNVCVGFGTTPYNACRIAVALSENGRLREASRALIREHCPNIGKAPPKEWSDLIAVLEEQG